MRHTGGGNILMTFLAGEVNSTEMFYLLGVEGKEVKIPSVEQK